MPEIKQEVKTYEINYICDTCKDGKMIDISKVAIVAPDESFQYEHECDKCKKRAYLNKQYPHPTKSSGPEIK